MFAYMLCEVKLKGSILLDFKRDLNRKPPLVDVGLKVHFP